MTLTFKSSRAADSASMPPTEPNLPLAALSKASISKRDRLLKLLDQPTPRSSEDLASQLNWQPRTLRAAISGLRKAGYMIETIKGTVGAPSQYRLNRGDQKVIDTSTVDETDQ